MPPNVFSGLLTNLVNGDFLKKDGSGNYSISDPMLEFALRSRIIRASA